jgi:hypothetical protein
MPYTISMPCICIHLHALYGCTQRQSSSSHVGSKCRVSKLWFAIDWIKRLRSFAYNSVYSSKLSSDRLRWAPTTSVWALATSIRAPTTSVRAPTMSVRAAKRAARTPTTCRVAMTDRREERRYNNRDHRHHDWLESLRARQFHCHRPVFCPKISTLPIFVFNTISFNHSNMLTWRSFSINIL